jgi:hypothetical protein
MQWNFKNARFMIKVSFICVAMTVLSIWPTLIGSCLTGCTTFSHDCPKEVRIDNRGMTDYKLNSFLFVQALSYPNTNTEVRFGASDAYSCNTLLDSLDTEYHSAIIMGGRTQSNRLHDGTNGCYDSGYTGKYRGYITRYSHTSEVWHKTYEF